MLATVLAGCAMGGQMAHNNAQGASVGTSEVQAGATVLRSSGPSSKDYPAGMKIAWNQVITLKSNDVVVLLGSGGTRTLRGPGRFSTIALAESSSSLVANRRRSRFGAIGGSAVGAIIPGVSVIEGAAVGASIGGLAGAVWADRNNDGYADGYVYNGRYYSGTPQGYDPTLRRVATGAFAGGALGAVAGAVIPGVSALEGAVVGAAIEGKYGAFWADADNDGFVDGYVYNGEYYRGIPPPPPPPPSPQRCCDPGEDPGVSLGGSTRLKEPAAYRDYRGSMGGARVNLDAVRVWQTTNGALVGSALTAILEQCIAILGQVGPECLAAVRAGAAEFSTVPEKARIEFATIYRDSKSCRPGGNVEACVEELQNAAMFRALPRGGLLLSPLKMHEGKRSVFTAQIRDSGEIEGRPGLPSDEGFEPVPGRPRDVRRITVAPYSPEMCFVLTSDDSTKAVIEPRPGDGRTVKPPARVCMKAASGMGAIKYDPSWWVTPLSGGKLNLSLDIEHFDDRGRTQNFPQQPRPIEIDVVPEPSAWDRADAFIRRVTGTVNLAIGLAQALGVLFTAIAGWGIWSWRKDIVSWLKGWQSASAPTP